MKTIHLHDPALSVKENKLILDNSQTIRNEILKFESSDNDTILYAVKNCEPDTIYEY